MLLDYLDATCGQRWMQRELGFNFPFVEVDILKVKRPTVKASYTHLPFKSNSFRVALFDPPFASGGDTKPLAQFWFHFGRTGKIGPFRKSMYQAFRELLRVLDSGATLVFKWGTSWKPLSWIIQYIPREFKLMRKWSRRNKGGNHGLVWFLEFKVER